MPRCNHRKDRQQLITAVLDTVQNPSRADHDLTCGTGAALVAHRKVPLAVKHKVELVLLSVIVQRLRLARLQAVHSQENAFVLEERVLERLVVAPLRKVHWVNEGVAHTGASSR